MNNELYEREYLRLHRRRLTQADLRIALIMSIIGVVLLNLAG